MKLFCYTLLLMLFPILANAEQDTVFTVTNSIYKIDYSCTSKGYLFFKTTLLKDTGNEPRLKPFHQEPLLPLNCRVSDTKSYGIINGTRYDLGHGVSSNAWDDSEEHMFLTNSLVNIVPQESNLNRHGAWRQFEVVENCLRNVDVKGITVVGGAIYNSPLGVTNNGASIPDSLWKIIIMNSTQNYIALLVPNTTSAAYDPLSKYIVSYDTVQKQVHNVVLQELHGMQIKEQLPANTINIPSGCNKN